MEYFPHGDFPEYRRRKETHRIPQQPVPTAVPFDNGGMNETALEKRRKHILSHNQHTNVTGFSFSNGRFVCMILQSYVIIHIMISLHIYKQQIYVMYLNVFNAF